MADGGGQKPIKNSLLSAANFFEEAAMLVPVPLEPESQEPATAEIDLNSDDSSSYRGSVEKEVIGQFSVNDESSSVTTSDETAAPISLFARAATGVDVFSRMLSGAPPPPKPAGSTTTVREVKEEPSIVTLRAASMAESVSEAPSNLFPITSTDSLTPIPTPGSSSGVIDLSATPSNSDSGTLSASIVFSSGNDFLDTSNSAPGLVQGSSMAWPRPVDVSQSTPTVSTDSVWQVPATGSVASVQSEMMTATTMTAPSTVVPLLPTFSDPDIPTVDSSPSTSANQFRLGAQKLKYVPCPELSFIPTALSPIQSFPSSVLTLSDLPGAPPPLTVPSHENNNQAMINRSPSAPSSLQSFGAMNVVASPGSYNAFAPTPAAHVLQSPRVNTESGMQNHPASPLTRPPVSTVNGHPYYSPAGHQPSLPQRLTPLTYHWFYRKDVDGKVVWKPFSIIDSVALEDSLVNDPERLVPTDGGRYDVCVKKRLKMPVYWDETPAEVRRGSWFYKGPMDNRFIPYDEEFGAKLEREYSDCMTTGIWQKRLEFPDGESVIMHSSGVVVHFCQAAAPDDWGNLPESQIRPRVVKRGVDEIEMEDGESTQIDHLVFVVHGIGPICDFKLRNIVEAVDDFRTLSIQLTQSHFREGIQRNAVGRVEFLPVSWHKALHGDRGIDEQLKRITLRSIPKFREFTNETLLDILFYTSPVYCQTIVDSVSGELNRLYQLFLSRNPTFIGKVSLTGHSLGSLILFDILSHQRPAEVEAGNKSKPDAESSVEKSEIEQTSQAPRIEGSDSVDDSGANSSSRQVEYSVGTAGTGQPSINYPQLGFLPTSFFALGSPIAMFVTVRGIEKLGNDFRFPTCPAFFNIFHPYDPVAYRIEMLIDPAFDSRPVLIPHHKGRKRIHLELKDTMARYGADIKQRVVDTLKSTWNTVSTMTGFTKTPENLENDIQSAIAGEMEKKSEADGPENANANITIGSLNGGRRIDHVLQEAPYETFNEYVFAMGTHLGYWESEDTMLLILTEIYATMGIQRDHLAPATHAVVSPTHSQAFAAVASSPMPYQPIATYGSAPINQFQPSAPPYLDHRGHSASSILDHPHAQPPMANTSSLFNAPVPSSSAPLYPGIPTMSAEPISNHASSVLIPPSLDAGHNPTSRPSVIGNRPVADPSAYPRGVDPTAPMLTQPKIGPPPTSGFFRK